MSRVVDVPSVDAETSKVRDFIPIILEVRGLGFEGVPKSSAARFRSASLIFW